MAASHFPCRVCGQPTQGADSYVVCLDCAMRFEMRFRESIGDGVMHLPHVTGDIEALLKKLVDDW